MLQFNKSQNTNTNAVYPDVEITSSIGGPLILEFTQSYDQSVTAVEVDVLNNPGVDGQQYIVIQLTGSKVPTPSGQYIANLFEGSLVEPTWIETAELWSAIQTKWNNGDPIVVKTTQLGSDRAYVSGSNEQTIVQYVSPDENGTYTTYNG